MRKEFNELASKLKAESIGKFISDPQYPDVDGVKYTYPCQWIEVTPYDMQVPPGSVETCRVMRELMVEEELPESWKDLIKQIGRKVMENGGVFPVDIVHSAYFVVCDHPDRARELGIENPEETDLGGPDFRDKEIVRNLVNGVVNDDFLREKLIEEAQYMTPDLSSGWLDFRPVAKALAKKKGILLDIGCGVGWQTVNHQQDLPNFKVIGVERQYHGRWYEPWKDENNGTSFVRCDAMGRLPFGDESIDYATVEFVVDHVTERGLSGILEEAARVLKSGGVIFIGPQDYVTGEDYWQAFRKLIGESGKSTLVGISLKDV